ncbi:family 43 glycosylhydrolase [Oscillospiraceae bacterium HV4-5-C5C]|nr:family 43 glycosylhydrolase [Oscillospiraceae bacterium HV4-5-C5C]
MLLYKRSATDSAPLAQPDPYMIEAGGKWYLYATGVEGVELFSSSDLFSGWHYDGRCLEVPGQHKFWAPSVIQIDDLYYMYYSSEPRQAHDDHQQTLYVATARQPEGPFKPINVVKAPFSIDAHVVQTPSGLYLFYCQNVLDQECVGTYIFCDRLTDPLHAEDQPVCVIRPSLQQEIYERDRFGDGKDWYTVEGPFYFYHEGWHYLTYSGGNHTNDSYFVGYASAPGPQAADLRFLPWKKNGEDGQFAPVLYKTDQMEGTGHNSVIKEGDQYWIVYHGRVTGSRRAGGPDTRVARIDRLLPINGQLQVSFSN